MRLSQNILTRFIRVSACALTFVAITEAVGLADEPVRASTDKEVKKPVRDAFPAEIREDFFEGFQGDMDRLKAGMEACQKILVSDPKHAEAMVWLGSGEMFQSGQAFQKGNVAAGMGLWTSSIEKMDKAAELEPDNIGVLIPRAAVLLPASRNAPAFMAKPVLKSVLNGFERTYEMQKDRLDQIGEHPLGELRMGLADVYRALDRPDESIAQLKAVLTELPGTEYADEAEQWLKAKPTVKLAHNCIGCHEG